VLMIRAWGVLPFLLSSSGGELSLQYIQDKLPKGHTRSITCQWMA
jgi:hypothetical protein